MPEQDVLVDHTATGMNRDTRFMLSLWQFALFILLTSCTGIADATLVRVGTARDLKITLEAGPIPEHVVITEHLNMSEYEVFDVTGPTKSILGDCASPPSEVPGPTPLRTVKPNQCILSSGSVKIFSFDRRLWRSVQQEDPSVWIANLYIRLVVYPNSSIEAIWLSGAVTLYLEDITFQWGTSVVPGAHFQANTIVLKEEARVHCQDCKWLNLTGFYSLVHLDTFSWLSLTDCSFEDIVLSWDHGNEYAGVVSLSADGAGVLMTATEFTNVEGYAVAGGPVSNTTAFVNDAISVSPNIARASVSSAPLGMFASSSDSALRSIKQDASRAATTDAPSPLPRSTGLPIGAIAGVSGSLVAVLVAGAFAVVVLRRQRRAKLADGQSTAVANAPDATPHLLTSDPSRKRDSPFVTLAPPTLVETQTLESNKPCTFGCQEQSTQQPLDSSTAGDWTSIMGSRPDPSTLPEGTADAAADNPTPDQVVCALDRLHSEQRLLFGGYSILGTSNADRRFGGQGVVQFVEDHTTRQQLAAKFFLKRADFLIEQQLYGTRALRAAMPGLIAVNDAGWQPQEWDDGGTGLPACLVMERGESLQEYVRAAGYNIFTTVQALGHVLQKLVDLHHAGWVHRDLKPANILWNPRNRCWALLDFGCVAKAGRTSTLAYTPIYAAPEVIHAHEEGKAGIVVHPAIDVWSFGVIAFEMLVEQPAFPRFTLQREVVDAAMGRTPYPWEDPLQGPLLLKKLGMFKKSILMCLARDPQQRVTGPQLIDIWGQMFSAQTSTTQS